MAGLTRNIRVPVFVGDAQDDAFFPGQAKILAKEIGNVSVYHFFSAEDGAGEHCSIGASVMESQVLMDWFDNILKACR